VAGDLATEGVAASTTFVNISTFPEPAKMSEWKQSSAGRLSFVTTAKSWDICYRRSKVFLLPAALGRSSKRVARDEVGRLLEVISGGEMVQ